MSAALHPAQQARVQPVLLVEEIHRSPLDGLDDHDPPPEEPPCVHGVDHPVPKGAQEIALAELEDPALVDARLADGSRVRVAKRSGKDI